VNNNQIYAVTGAQGSGKTTFLNNVIAELTREKVHIGGFIAEGIWKADKRHGFNLISIQDGISMPLCLKEPVEGYMKLGHFYFNLAAIQFGNEIIKRDKKHAEIIIIDEIGIFELEEKLWYEAFDQLLKMTSMPVLISVREKIVQQVIEKFNLKRVKVVQADDRVDETVGAIISGLKTNNGKQ
jgi:nucleoside-triphosphatase THEP1